MSLEDNGELKRNVINELIRVDDLFRKIGKKNRDELDFYGQQMKFLKIDKNKMDEAAELLNLRVKDCETDVGFRFVYD